ncbi:trypsin-like serine protease [Sphaerisporangium sp. B11E5]|uniref:S1 family peptidase n=1 Tax=Sphaerisporangium sp. B11E5 TaxID=3153563 RepID=UPI00325DD99F
MFRRPVVTAGCVFAFTALSLIGPAATADRASGAFTAVPAKPPPGMLEALQRDLGLPRSQAMQRLLNETRLAPAAALLRQRLGARFGGSWFSGPTSAILTVATTSAADLPEITAAGARGQVVGKSLVQLKRVLAEIDAVPPTSPDVIAVHYIEVRTNKVVVLSPKPSDAAAHIKSIGIEPDVVVVRPSNERPRPLYDLVGGDAYYINGTSRCSVGFSVLRGTQSAFVSAGHCGRAGAPTKGYNQADQGTFQASVFPGNDYSWIAVNANWTPRPLVRSTTGATVSVAGAREVIEGASVCRIGSTSGWHCGTVQQRDATVQYPQGNVYHLTRTNACAEPGDSGGPFVSVDQAQGVTSGGSGDCSAGGTTYFQPILPILSFYGLSLVTTAGNPPPPDTGTCTGYPRTATGSLNAGQSAYQPGNLYYRSTVQKTHTGCLSSPAGTDFDLYLEKWSGRAWLVVASSTSPANRETISYTGTPGYYRYRVVAYAGSGAYTLGFSTP